MKDFNDSLAEALGVGPTLHAFDVEIPAKLLVTVLAKDVDDAQDQGIRLSNAMYHWEDVATLVDPTPAEVGAYGPFPSLALHGTVHVASGSVEVVDGPGVDLGW